MKQSVEKRNPSSIVDYIALALTTFGVGYIPGAPGTYGSAIGVGIYLIFIWLQGQPPSAGSGAGLNLAFITMLMAVFPFAVYLALLIALSGLGIWASNRTITLLGNEDASEAVVDEVIGQLVTFCFVPFGIGWPFIVAGFLLFRLFDIFKPFPINHLQNLSGGLGICADDIVAGVYAGVCLAVSYAVYMSI